MACGDVLSLEDLQTAKKHQIFEAEVITGKAGGVAGGADIDYATNQVTGQTQKTLPAILRDAGFRPASFTFVTGGVLAVGDSDMAVLWPISAGGDGQYYIWKGAYPKTIPASSSPATSGGVSASGWLPLGDITLRQELASTATGKGVSLVANAADKRGETFTGGVSAIGLKSPTLYGDAIIGDNPVGSPGADYPGPEALRDAVTVSRKLVNTPTDCHGFSDKTVIDTPSDYGGYGSFDATVILRGAHTQDHVACFQARTKLEGAGIVKNLWGNIVWPVSTGTSTVQVNIGAFIKNVETSTSVVERNRGIDIVPSATTQENIGVNVRTGDCLATPPKSFVSEQTGNGYSLYAHHLGALYNKGKAFFGDFDTDNPAGASGASALNVRGVGSSVMAALDSTNSDGALVIATGDSRVSFVSNVALLGYWGDTSDSRGWIAANNTVPLGTVDKRWNTAYLVTSPNVSSDERFKDFEAVSDAEVSCAREVKSIMRKYRLKNDSDKIHFGVGAQSVIRAFKKHGLNAMDYNIVSVDSDGLYSVAYEELLCFVVLGL